MIQGIDTRRIQKRKEPRPAFHLQNCGKLLRKQFQGQRCLLGQRQRLQWERGPGLHRTKLLDGVHNALAQKKVHEVLRAPVLRALLQLLDVLARVEALLADVRRDDAVEAASGHLLDILNALRHEPQLFKCLGRSFGFVPLSRNKMGIQLKPENLKYRHHVHIGKLVVCTLHKPFYLLGSSLRVAAPRNLSTERCYDSCAF